ncbi:MAG: hypothetical protein ACR2PS_03435 [Pseudomonadales bacterium]
MAAKHKLESIDLRHSPFLQGDKVLEVGAALVTVDSERVTTRYRRQGRIVDFDDYQVQVCSA